MATSFSSGFIGFAQGWRQDLPDRGLGSPIGRLYNRIEGIFLSIRTQFSVKNSPIGLKLIERGPYFKFLFGTGAY